jgi:positive regulator of sigma E activity
MSPPKSVAAPSALAYCLPLVGLFVVARCTTGWLSMLAFVALFVGVLGLLVVGVVLESRGWGTLEENEDADE